MLYMLFDNTLVYMCDAQGHFSPMQSLNTYHETTHKGISLLKELCNLEKTGANSFKLNNDFM